MVKMTIENTFYNYDIVDFNVLMISATQQNKHLNKCNFKKKKLSCTTKLYS